MIPTVTLTRLSPRPQLGNRELLVLCPSLGTTTALWHEVAHELDAEYDILAADLPGHGRSPLALNPFTIAELADGVLDAVESLTSIDRFHIAGDSVGGGIAVSLGLTAPERVASVTMVCSSPRFGDSQAWRDRAALVLREGAGALLPGLDQRWLSPQFRDRQPERAVELLDGVRTMDPRGYASVCEALAAYDVRAELSRINCPFLAVAGEYDTIATPQLAEEMAAAVTGGRVLVLPQVAHQAPWEAPAELAVALREQLRLASLAAVRASSATSAQRYAAGLAVRRQVLGDAHVDRATAAMTGLTRGFQEFITCTAWGEVWTDVQLSRRERSIAVLTALIAHAHWDEFAMHVRGAVSNGLSPEDIRAVIMQSAIYCGVPAANSAFGITCKVLTELADDSEPNA
ncbi:MAG: alpha/beta fold hydrolase [Segniliparus sp.]|uniref:bifunctional 3-oxoadipate enol-lactonase/4-carboxymuconolactone decarboxylase PcaDC n=1 Tax=Segniliparus sp. TaxID=2804064 RepID=UPI003F2FAF21